MQKLSALVLLVLVAAAFAASGDETRPFTAVAVPGVTPPEPALGATPDQGPGVPANWDLVVPPPEEDTGPPGSDSILYDTGRPVGNAYYWNQNWFRSISATMATPAYYPAFIVQIGAHVLTTGDVYWPWPDATHDTFRLGIWLDRTGDNVPDEPAVYADRIVDDGDANQYFTYTKPVMGTVMLSSGNFWIGYQMDTTKPWGGPKEGMTVDPATNYPTRWWWRDGSSYPGVWSTNIQVSGDHELRGWTMRQQQHDFACTGILVPGGTCDSGVSLVPQARVMNVGLNTETNVPVIFKAPAAYVDTVWVPTLASFRDTVLRFDPWLPLQRGPNVLTCSTALSGDEVPVNDKSTLTTVVHVMDVGCITILSPTGSYDSSSTATPLAIVMNYGTRAAGFRTRMKVGTDYVAEESTYLETGENRTLTFPDWMATARGIHMVKCSTMCRTDLLVRNNSRVGYVRVDIHDVGAQAIAWPSGANVPKGNNVPRVTLKNFGTLAEYDIKGQFEITDSGGLWYSETSSVAGPINPNGTATMLFPPWYASLAGTFFGRFTMTLVGDLNPDNDTISNMFTVVEALRDVGVTQINEPTASEDTFPKLPRATAKNFGEVEEFIQAWMEITDTVTDAQVYFDSATTASAVPPNGTGSLDFPQWATPIPPGPYVAVCYTNMPDPNPSNDSARLAFNVTTGPPPPPPGWLLRTPVPPGGKGKGVKDGGSLAYSGDETDAPYIYAFKGNNRCEFYKYNIADNTWATKESIPAIGSMGKKKTVKKGAALAVKEGKAYGVKGNNSLEFWQYDPLASGVYNWKQFADVPMGGKNVKEGAGMATVRIGDTTYIYFLKGSGTFEFYRFDGTAWTSMANAPGGTSGKGFKNGSCIGYNGDSLIYALKASYNEFFAYNINSNTWTTLLNLPLTGSSGKKKKVKDGAGVAPLGGYMYALKGGNTTEFWQYQADSNKWAQAPDIPLGTKRVKGGGSLVYAPAVNCLYALKGNNTTEFYSYGAADFAGTAKLTPNAMGNAGHVTGYRLLVAPNPFTSATVVSYSLPVAGNVSIKLYDVTGTLVSTLVSGHSSAGNYTVSLGNSQLARGIYLLSFKTDNYGATEKLILE